MAPSTSMLVLAAAMSTGFARAASALAARDSPQASHGNTTPFGIPDAAWDAALTQPNATGSSSFTGPSLSSAAGVTINAWLFNISVAADIPLAESSATSVNKTQVVTGTEVSFDPLQGLSPQDTNREDVFQDGCLVIGIPGLTPDANAKSLSDASEREQCRFIPDDCQQRLSSLALSITDDATNLTAAGFCKEIGGIQVPSQCKDYIDWSNKMAIPVNETQATQTGKLFSFADAPHDRGNLTAYNAAVQKTWVVLNAWRHTIRLDNGTNSTQSSFASLECIQAADVTQGSHTPGNAGAALRPPLVGSLALFLLGSAAVLLL